MRFALLSLIITGAAISGCAGILHAELQRARTSQKPIFVGDIAASRPNKRGAVSALAQFFNTSAKTYKYVDIHIEAYNRVGDRITRDNDKTPIVLLRFTGPLRMRRTPGVVTWPRVWPVGAVGCLEIKRIDIFHMDGTTLALEGPALNSVLAQKLTKGCKRA